MKMGSIIRIMIADDHDALRFGLRKSLDLEMDFQVVAEAANGREAITVASEFNPDIVLMDVSMPLLNGIEATRIICSGSSDVKVLGLSMYCNKLYVIGMINAGAAGFLLKTCSYKELSQAVRSVAQGDRYFASEVAGFLEDNGMNRSSVQVFHQGTEHQ